MIVPLVLAAGESSRMGQPKAALPFGETTALGLVLDACLQAELAPPVLVLGAHRQVLEPLARRHPVRPRVTLNRDWAKGRTSSILAGLEILSLAARALLLWPVDVCLVEAPLVRALLAAREREPDRAVWVPSHAQRRGHPVLLDVDEVVPRLRALGPDEPARDVIRALAAEDRVCHVEVDDPAVLWDMDTPEDYRARLKEWGRRQIP